MERVTEASVRRQRTIQTSLLLIILATLPCYCVGFVLLGVAPQRAPTTPTPPGSQVATSTTSAANPTDTLFPTIATITPIVIKTLTPTPIIVKTATPIPPTNTPIPPTATHTSVPPTATKSPTPTNTTAPSDTPTSTSTNTLTPTP